LKSSELKYLTTTCSIICLISSGVILQELNISLRYNARKSKKE
jgi:hypothetical protein